MVAAGASTVYVYGTDGKVGNRMASSSKRQTTMAKFSREQALRERRARKQEKKDERKNAATTPDAETGDTTSEAEVEVEIPAV